MKFYIVFILFLAIYTNYIHAQTRVTHFVEKCNVANAGGQYTSVTTAPNGDIYSAWMDDKRNLKVSKFIVSTNTNVIEILRVNMQLNKYHVRPSIVLDKFGYVHVAADMHNQNWVYYRSLAPYEIRPSNFEMVTPPGFLVTYPNFFKDKNDDLYITFRHKVKPSPNQFSVGSSAGGIIKYDAVTKTFTMLGGRDHGLEKTVIWVNMGGTGVYNPATGITTPSHYQQPNIRLFFDNSNRMHMICNLINQPTTGASDANTHVLYAYSDDGGLTFKRIDGTVITSMPMGPTSMTIVSHRPQSDISADCYIGAFDTNRPVVSWRSSGEGSRIAFWNGSVWQLIAPGGSYAGRKLFSRRNGETLFFVPEFNFLHRTFNGGASYQQYTFNPKYFNTANQPTESEIIDADFYLKTGNVRYQFSNSTTEDSIFLSTISFSSNSSFQFLDVNAKIDLNKILLNWHTYNDVDLSHFVIEKLISLNSWQSILTINAKGNFNVDAYYNVFDYQLKSQNTYRIKSVGKNGEFTYSKIVTVNLEKINTVYYDQGTKSLVIRFESANKLEFMLLNSLGQVFKKGLLINNLIQLNNLPSGIYCLKLNNGIVFNFIH